MIEIKMYEDGELKKIFENVKGISIDTIGYGNRLKTRLDFACDQVTEPLKPWSGKIICVANRGTYSFTPGKVYKVTENDVYDDTNISFTRRNGPCCIFSVGTFKALQNDFLRQGIDIIEYKGGAEL